MKKVIGLLCFLLIGLNAFAKPIITTSVGFGGFENFANQSFGAGGTQVINDCIPMIFEFNWSWAESSTYDSSGEQVSFDGSGFMFKTGYTALTPNKPENTISAIVGIGLFRYYDSEDVYSTLYDKEIHVQDSSPENKLELSGGVLININKIAFTLEYDNMRGVVLGIGGTF